MKRQGSSLVKLEKGSTAEIQLEQNMANIELHRLQFQLKAAYQLNSLQSIKSGQMIH